jgi:peptide/nickel transport system substrate-binding protein
MGSSLMAASVLFPRMGLAQGDRPSLRVGIAKLPAGLDPSMNISNTGQRITASIYDKMIARAYWEGEHGEGAELAPSIATSWNQVEPTVWEVKLRKDVKFHDGTPMTAEDVAFSFGEERMWGEKRMLAAGVSYFGSISAVDVVDDETLHFTTKDVDPIFPARFTSPLGMVVPKKYFTEKGVDGFNLAPIATGPYKLAELRPDEVIHLVSHDDYWGGAPPAKEITFREIPEEAGRITGLLNGELDLITDVSPDQVAALTNGGAVVKSGLIDNTRVVVLNTLQAPMDDKNLRQALIWAIDRQAIVDALWQGQNIVPHDLNFPSHGEDFLADRPIPTYNPDKAKELLGKSKYKGETLTFRMQGGYYANYEEVAQVLQQQWRDIGINVNIEIRDNFQQVTAKPVHMFAHSNGMQIVDITQPISNLYGPQGIRTLPDAPAYSWNPPERFTELLHLMETTVDHDERMKYFVEALDIFEDERPQIELYQALEYYGLRQGIEWKPYAFWPMDFSANNLKFA